MLKGFLGNNGTREHEPSLRVLVDEKRDFENARMQATETHRPQVTNVDGKNVVIMDGRHSGEWAIPLENIDSVV